MKKIISLLVALTLCLLLLAGCADKFDMAKSIDELRAKGLTKICSYTTEEELSETNKMISSFIRIMGGDFTVTITEYYSLIQGNDRTQCVEFIVFASVDEASSYANLYISQDPHQRPARIAQNDRVLIITNLALVEDVLSLDFF